jgi:hypothetical protein
MLIVCLSHENYKYKCIISIEEYPKTSPLLIGQVFISLMKTYQQAWLKPPIRSTISKVDQKKRRVYLSFSTYQ